ncbi:hypothetical protein SELMODRAFT_139027 [Selaginella moellendorffii]|uniref:Bulb-type lectin domain-containing protein n=1 Tax=Selaginella moellendorffii TaxID=88036 RepID=D8TGI3_SELML|nr:hypothetical protein SELMODRAFT_139027 [Selaginella moellendorffii]
MDPGTVKASPNKLYELILLNNCEIQLVDVKKKISYWNSNTGNYGQYGCKLRLQTDGNIVLYQRNGDQIYTINKYCSPSPCELPSILTIQDDGNLVLYRSLSGSIDFVIYRTH